MQFNGVGRTPTHGHRGKPKGPDVTEHAKSPEPVAIRGVSPQHLGVS